MNTKNITQLWKDYRYHRLADKAEAQLRFHSNAELKDIGITRSDISRMAHSKCGWCSKPQEGDDLPVIREMTAGERQASRVREVLNNPEEKL